MLRSILETDISLAHDAEGVVATDRFTADLAQFCIASHDPVPAKMDEVVNIRFVPEPVVNGEVELELEADDCDTMFHDGQIIDLGEAVAQSLGLALNLCPRSPEAEKMLKAAGANARKMLKSKVASRG